MCEDCEKIEEAIARYLRLKSQTEDSKVHKGAEQLVAELKGKMAALHGVVNLSDAQGGDDGQRA